jgi:hypothetical protein
MACLRPVNVLMKIFFFFQQKFNKIEYSKEDWLAQSLDWHTLHSIDNISKSMDEKCADRGWQWFFDESINPRRLL